MQRVKATLLGAWLNKFGGGKHGWRQGNRALNQVGTMLDADWMDSVQEELCGVIEATGAAINPELRNQLLLAIKDIAAYDIPFHAGFDGAGEAVDLVAQRYGMLIATRAATFTAIVGAVLTAPTGAAIQVDVKKNGVSVFSTLPTIAIGQTVLAGAVFSGGAMSAAPGDLIHFHVLQVGSAIKGKGLHIGLCGRRA